MPDSPVHFRTQFKGFPNQTMGTYTCLSNFSQEANAIRQANLHCRPKDKQFYASVRTQHLKTVPDIFQDLFL